MPGGLLRGQIEMTFINRRKVPKLGVIRRSLQPALVAVARRGLQHFVELLRDAKRAGVAAARDGLRRSEHRPLARIVPLGVLGRDTRCKQRTSPCTPVCEFVHRTCYKSGSCCAGEASRARSAGVANVACRGR